MLYMLALLQEAAAASSATGRGLGLIGAGLAAGLAVLGAGVGIGASLLATGVMVLEVFVAFLQAFVFTLLTAVFIGLMRAEH